MRKFYGLLVWFIVTLFVVYAFCLNTASAVFSEVIKSSLQADELGVSLASAAFILGFACMQIPAGYLLDKYNARYVVSTGVLLLAVGNIVISFSDNITIYTLSNLMQGVGASFAFVAAAVLISQWFSEKLFPIMFGLTQTLSCVFAGVIHYYFTVMLATHTWNSLYQGLSAFGFILFGLTLLFVKSPVTQTPVARLSLRESLAIVLSNKQLWLCAIAAATSLGVLLAYAGFWYMQIQAFYKVENLQAVLVSGTIFFGIGIGTPILGWISNRVKSRVMVIHVMLCAGVMALLLGIYLPNYHFQSLVIIKIISFLIGFFLSGSMLFYTMVSEFSTDSTRGVAISVLNTAVFLFNTVLLFLPYLFFTYLSKDFFTYLWVLPFFIVFALLLLYFVKDTYK